MSIWSSRIVDPGLMTSLQRTNLIAYRLVSSSSSSSFITPQTADNNTQ